MVEHNKKKLEISYLNTNVDTQLNQQNGTKGCFQDLLTAVETKIRIIQYHHDSKHTTTQNPNHCND